MGQLSDSQAMTLLSAGVLYGRAADVLSDFEREIVADACERFVRQRRHAYVTDNEWPVIERSIEAMRAEISRRQGRKALRAFDAEADV